MRDSEVERLRGFSRGGLSIESSSWPHRRRLAPAARRPHSSGWWLAPREEGPQCWSSWWSWSPGWSWSRRS